MTIMGNTAETDQKIAGVTGHTESPRLSSLLSKLPLFRLEHCKPDAPVRPEMGIKTQQPGALDQLLSGLRGISLLCGPEDKPP